MPGVVVGMRRQKGDTIIEVMVAVTIFSLVAVGSMVIMNRGISMAQRSLEITLARQQIDSQVEMLRYVHILAKEDPSSNYGQLWNRIKNDTRPNTSSPKRLLNESQCPDGKLDNSVTLINGPTPNNISIVDGANYSQPQTYAKIESNQSQGLSIQMTKVSGGNAYDAYIQGCWYSPGSEQPVTIGTIVRLYDAEA